MIPSHRQIVFHGDRLLFLCTATYVDKTMEIQWRHNGKLMVTDEDNEISVEPVMIHDCCLITRYDILCVVSLKSNSMFITSSYIIDQNILPHVLFHGVLDVAKSTTLV